MPTMSRQHAAGDVRGVMALNSRNNVLVGSLLYPALAFAFAFAEELVTIVYTSAYVEAAPVMRLYIVGLAVMVVEVGSLVLLLKQGAFTLKLSAAALAVSVAVSWTGAHAIGLVGAAAGSVLAIYLDRAVLLRRISRVTGIALRDMQDWGALARSAALAAACAALAWILVHHILAQAGPMTRVAAGATILALVYAPIQFRKKK
jgi:O-antigen/teichoic acid export membrane protein